MVCTLLAHGVPSPQSSAPFHVAKKTLIRLGHLGLLDAAPLLVGAERGFFSHEGLNVEISCELGIAAICGKLADNHLSGACMPAQMHVLLSLGAGTARVPMDGVLVTSYQDMAIVLATRDTANGKPEQIPITPLRLGMLVQSSPAKLLVQRWLHLDRVGTHAEPVYVPLAASQLLGFLEDGVIDGFCGSDPLGAVARSKGLGTVIANSAGLFPLHPGSAVALRADFTQHEPRTVEALARALLRSRSYCADPANLEEVWRLVLAQNPFRHRNDERLAAVAQPFGTGSLEGPSIRYDGPASDSGLDAESALFLEHACHAAFGSALRGGDFKTEITRIFGVAPARVKKQALA